MSLEKYCHHRLIVLRAGASAFEAARAMDTNHVGAVLIHHRGRVIGILTDRDLALRVVARGVDPVAETVREVMTPDPATIEIDQSEGEAAALMRGMLIRRLVVLDHGRLAGIVTLDDLVVDGAVDRLDVQEIIRGQLSEPAAGKPEGLMRPQRIARRASGGRSAQRRKDRQQQTMRRFLARLKEDLGLQDDEDALNAFEVVTANIVRRLTPGEAKDFAAQLPSVVREHLLDVRQGPDRSITLPKIEAEVAQRLEVDGETAAELVSRVGASLPDFISAGELADVRQQLPQSLQRLIPQAA
jgi:uncharacterized protein (DUF2267 family)/CBS domain-containing protein